jgi:hypothetical protein
MDQLSMSSTPSNTQSPVDPVATTDDAALAAPAGGETARSLNQPEPADAEHASDELADDEAEVEQEAVLVPVLSPRWALGPEHLLLVMALAVLYMTFNYVGVRPTDVWCHVAFGDWILAQRTLPAEDPFLPFSEGVPIVDTAWLGQIFFSLIYRAGGEALSAVFAFLGLATMIVLCRAFYLQSRRVSLTIVAIVLVVAVGWSRLWTLRPEVFAWLLFACELWIVARLLDAPPAASPEGGRGWSQGMNWVGMGVIFVLWANMHGTFVCGVAVLGCYAVGRAVEVAWSSRDGRAVLTDGEFRRWLLLTELAAGATLFNPYGLDLWLQTMAFATNENLRDIIEWAPLTLGSYTGLSFGLSWLVLLAAFRHSRRRVRPAEVLLVVLFSAAAAVSVRMLTWYAPIVVFVLLPHLAEMMHRLRPLPPLPPPPTEEELASGGYPLPPGRHWRYNFLSLAVIWLAFAFSPASFLVWGKSGRTLQQLYTQQTPLAATEYLRANPPQGQLWNPTHWGDWLLVAGPQNPRPKVFVTSMVHHVPRRVWEDYQQVYFAQPGWQGVLDRYNIATLIIDKRNQAALTPVIKRSPDWTIRHEDDDALVLTRRESRARLPDERQGASVDSLTQHATPSPLRRWLLSTPANDGRAAASPIRWRGKVGPDAAESARSEGAIAARTIRVAQRAANP